MIEWRIERLSRAHDRALFDCGESSRNTYLRQYAAQDAKRDLSRTYVATSIGSDTVGGYYTISSDSVEFALLPARLAKRLPKYPVPTAHLGRLAVDRRIQGRGLGAFLLIDAFRRVGQLADGIGIHALTVRALNDTARSFYQSHGFIPLTDDPRHLFLTLATVREVLRILDVG
jgi:ribosomal protein S18 acetylase RimI-like enzyme